MTLRRALAEDLIRQSQAYEERAKNEAMIAAAIECVIIWAADDWEREPTEETADILKTAVQQWREWRKGDKGGA